MGRKDGKQQENCDGNGNKYDRTARCGEARSSPQRVEVIIHWQPIWRN